MTATGEHMHEEAKRAKEKAAKEAAMAAYKKEWAERQTAERDLESTNRELRQWIAASIGQLRYAQWLLSEPVHARSEQIDEFIQKLEDAIR